MQAVSGVRWYGQPRLLPAPPPPRQGGAGGGAAAGGVRSSAGAQATGRSLEFNRDMFS
jgi:hypothetical protein